jgi:hypothetical protein
MRLIWTNWQHPTGFLPADLMHKCGQGVSAPGMLAACHADLTDSVCEIHDGCYHSRSGEIVSVLSDMDAEISALERRRDKTRVVKQGMMQQLLTGRVRLIKLTRTMEASVC